MNLFKSILVVCIVLVCKINCNIVQERIFGALEDILINDLSNSSELYDNNSIQLRNDGYDDLICRLQFLAFIQGINNTELWAIQMLDAWGKIPAGVLSGNLFELGNFEQCLRVEAGSASDVAGIFNTQYCLAQLGFDILGTFEAAPDVSTNNIKYTMARGVPSLEPIIGLSVGICLPSSCSPRLANELMDTALAQINLPIKFVIAESMCQRDEILEFSAVDIFAIVFFSTIAFIMVASTIYDVLMIRYNKNRYLALIAFSMYTNGKKIFQCTKSNKSSEVMDCINGIRVLSIVWVVYCHGYVTLMMSPLINTLDLLSWLERASSMLVMAGTVAVDTFFMLSGLLLTLSALRQLDRNKGRINILWLYLHRYIRLTPVLAATLLFWVSLLKHMGGGPLWPSNMEFFVQPCETYWWRVLLYIQNYDGVDKICLIHTWYLSVDMQLFILSPLILYPLWRWRNKFIAVVPLLILVSIACAFTIFMLNDFSVKLLDSLTTLEGRFNRTYLPTHTRMGAWLVGVILAYIMHKVKGKTANIPKIIIITGWTIALGTVFAIVFGFHPMQLQETHVSTVESAFYETFSRVTWAMALSWIVFACVHGYGGPINWFLSFPQWQPFARISYSIYMIHFPFQLARMAALRTTSNFNDLNAIHKVWGDFGITISLAIFWTMAFESPIVTLEKIIGGKTFIPPTTPSKENLIKENEQHINGGQNTA